MTNKTYSQKRKSRVLGVVLLLLTFILSCTCAFACSKDEPEQPINYNPSFDYDETLNDSESIIANADFNLGLTEKEKDDYPVSSVSGWSLSTDEGAKSSAVTSGIVNVDMWRDTVINLVKDDEFKAWATDTYSVTTTEKTDEEIADALITAGFLSPERDSSVTDKNVLMIANVTDDDNYVAGLGTAQSYTSSSTITIAKSASVKISVFVKTEKVTCLGSTDFGANIRIDSHINGVAQAQYAIENIIADDWTEYSIFVRGNDNVESSITLSLGLGFGGNDTLENVSGIAYFDGIKVEEFKDTADYDGATKGNETNASLSTSTYLGNPDDYRVSGATEYYYNLADEIDTFVTTDATITDYTNEITTNNKATVSGGTITLDKQIGAVKISDGSGNFTVAPKSVTVIRFTVKNNLNHYYNGGVDVILKDINNEYVTENELFTVFRTDDEDGNATATTYTLTVINSFPTGDRNFELLLVVGPTNPLEQTSNLLYPSGIVEITDVKYTKGTLEDPDNIEENKQYKFISTLSTGTFDTFSSYSLYAGNDGVYVEDEENETYNVTVSGINKYNIKTMAVAPIDYMGVVANHQFVKENGTETAINTNEFAGVINSKYTYSELAPNFGTLEKDNDGNDIHIQPLFINNKTETSYGYLGSSKTVSAGSTAKISLKVKVDEDAKAYIYLVSMANDDTKLDVLTHTYNEKVEKLCIEVGDTNGEWKDVTFCIAAGKTPITYRVEMWNGARDESVKSEGKVYFNEINYGTFTEATTNPLFTSGNPLYDAYLINAIAVDDVKSENLHTRELTETEKKFNEEYPDQKVSYSAKYVWAKGNGIVYAIYNTIDPVITNPYDDIETEDEDVTEEESGCKANFNSGTFWLQFSSILLAVILVFAILLLIIKTFRRKHNKTKKVKSRYNVRSRNTTLKKIEKVKEDQENQEIEEYTANVNDEVEEETTEETEYVYGEVLEDFGDDIVIDGNEIEIAEETTDVNESEIEEKTEEVSDATTENESDDKSAE